MWCRMGKVMEEDGDGMGEEGKQMSGDGYNANVWAESFPRTGGRLRRRSPVELPRTTDPRGQGKNWPDRSLERGAGWRETLKVKADYMFGPKPFRVFNCVEFQNADRPVQNNQRMTEARGSGRRTTTRILIMFL